MDLRPDLLPHAAAAPFFALAALLAALVAVRITARWTPALPSGRFDTIDGLRGYLAFGVFLHHASIWPGFVHHGGWVLPASNLFVNLGQASVSLFFMITSFLFYGKLLAQRDRPVDWLRLYCSRVLRLYPLYLCALGLLLLIVGARTGWQLRQPATELLRQIAHWIAFTAPGTPDINGLRQTSIVMAGVTWSLPYEWAFYLCLPLLALVLRIPVTAGWLLFGVAAGVSVVILGARGWPLQQYVIAFSGGIVAAHAVRSGRLQAFARSRAGSVALLAMLAGAYCAFPSAYRLGSAVLLIGAFIVVASGGDLFGLLRWRLSRVFGEYAYGLYLFHGIALYAVFECAVGRARASMFSTLECWMTVCLVAPFLVVFCALAFRWIEQPMMGRTDRVVRALRGRREPAAAASVSQARRTG